MFVIGQCLVEWLVLYMCWLLYMVVVMVVGMTAQFCDDYVRMELGTVQFS